MTFYSHVSTGWDSLDAIIDHLRRGDNVVWQVDTIEEYQKLVTLFVNRALANHERVIYLRFARHIPLLEPRPNLTICELDIDKGFEVFSTQVHGIITREGRDIFYVFDSLSDLLHVWATDLMIVNFFFITCPYLFELNTIAYFAILRNRHSFKAIARIRETTQLPAGDIGVGGREIGYMFGYYKKIRNEHTGVLTGKGLEYGGSLIRPEATGYGTVYFAAEMLATRGLAFKNKIVAVSGAGNVAQYAIEKATEMGGRVISVCDSNATIIDEQGIDQGKCCFIMDLKNEQRGRIKEYADKYQSVCIEGRNVWDVIREQGIKVDIALPCATQNELDGEHAAALVKSGCICVAEGANMPSTPEAIRIFQENNLLYGPGKAANAGGVATSGLEMSQNSLKLSWSREEVDRRLLGIMKNIHADCLSAAEAYGKKGDYVAGANIAGFLKVAKAMLAYGIV